MTVLARAVIVQAGVDSCDSFRHIVMLGNAALIPKESWIPEK